MPDNQWHLDKRVPVSIILGMIGQVFFVVWILAVMVKDVETNSKSLAALDLKVSALEGDASDQAIQLGRIEENLHGLRRDIGGLMKLIERQMR